VPEITFAIEARRRGDVNLSVHLSVVVVVEPTPESVTRGRPHTPAAVSYVVPISTEAGGESA